METNRALQQSQRAIKIALTCCLILLVLGSIGVWLMINQIAATALMSHKIKELEQRIEKLEPHIQSNSL